MNKKGAELSFNIIIIVILLIIVLVVVAAFFTGSFTKLQARINQEGPDNLINVIGDCKSKCGLAGTYDTENQRKKSGYCTSTWHFDTDKDGKVEKVGDEQKEFHCWDYPIEETCPGVEKDCERGL